MSNGSEQIERGDVSVLRAGEIRGAERERQVEHEVVARDRPRSSGREVAPAGVQRATQSNGTDERRACIVDQRDRVVGSKVDRVTRRAAYDCRIEADVNFTDLRCAAAMADGSYEC